MRYPFISANYLSETFSQQNGACPLAIATAKRRY
jgi:hypothetical protein